METISLTVYSPHVVDLTLVDLPKDVKREFHRRICFRSLFEEGFDMTPSSKNGSLSLPVGENVRADAARSSMLPPHPHLSSRACPTGVRHGETHRVSPSAVAASSVNNSKYITP